jgi:hypothetical protein
MGWPKGQPRGPKAAPLSVVPPPAQPEPEVVLTKDTIVPPATEHRIVRVKFNESCKNPNASAAIGEKSIVRELTSEQVPMTDDFQGRGVWVGDHILVPFSNIRWVEYQ